MAAWIASTMHVVFVCYPWVADYSTPILHHAIGRVSSHGLHTVADITEQTILLRAWRSGCRALRISSTPSENRGPGRIDNRIISFVRSPNAVGVNRQQLSASPSFIMGGCLSGRVGSNRTAAKTNPNNSRRNRPARGVDRIGSRAIDGHSLRTAGPRSGRARVRLVAFPAAFDLLDLLPHRLNAGRASGLLRRNGAVGPQAEESSAPVVPDSRELSGGNRANAAGVTQVALGTPVASANRVVEDASACRIGRATVAAKRTATISSPSPHNDYALCVRRSGDCPTDGRARRLRDHAQALHRSTNAQQSVGGRHSVRPTSLRITDSPFSHLWVTRLGTGVPTPSAAYGTLQRPEAAFSSTEVVQ